MGVISSLLFSQVEWTPDRFTFSVDDQFQKSVEIPAGGFWELGQFEQLFPGTANPWLGRPKEAPFDKEFFFIFNVAVGGVA